MQASKARNSLASPAARELLQRNAEVFKALGNEQRSAIVCALSAGEMAVGDIADCVGLSIQNASQHLRVLKGAGVVHDRREGQRVFYEISNPKFLAACCLIRDAIIEQSEGKGLADAGKLIFGGAADLGRRKPRRK